MAATATELPAAADVRDGKADADMMVRNGITQVRADHYLVDGYRYANVADPLAQVRRGAAKRAHRP